MTVTATTTDPANAAVTWSLTGAGTLTTVDSETATYVAPATPASGVTITATLVSNTSIAGSLAITVVDITTDVAPITLSVGTNLTPAIYRRCRP